jgi:hypothetical protein
MLQAPLRHCHHINSPSILQQTTLSMCTFFTPLAINHSAPLHLLLLASLTTSQFRVCANQPEPPYVLPCTLSMIVKRIHEGLCSMHSSTSVGIWSSEESWSGIHRCRCGPFHLFPTQMRLFIDHLHCCFYPFCPSHTLHPFIYLC